MIKTNAFFFAAIASVLVMKFKALEQLIFRVVVQPRCVVGPRVSPNFKVDGQATCTRMSMDIRVHIGRNPRSQHEGGFENFSSLTINAPLIVKDEVDKVFELILFRNKTKNLGLRLIGPSPGPPEGPRDRSMITILIE